MSVLQDRLASLAQAQLAVTDELGRMTEAVVVADAEAKAMAEKLAQPPVPNGPWGPGEHSGHRWWSGVAWRGQTACLNTFVAGPRCGVKVDVVQVFGPGNAGLKDTWDHIAGGPGDDPTKLDGTLTTTKGSKQGQLIWADPILGALPIIFSVRPIPASASNEEGRNPAVWREIASGEHDKVYQMLGRRMAYLDQKHGRTAPLALEIAWEMNGSWYSHSIEGALPDGPFCWQIFPSAWSRIVEGIRQGYLSLGGKHCPYQFVFRPARVVLAGGVRMDRFLPSPGTWDAIGLTCHDNPPFCSPAEPRAAWNLSMGKDNKPLMEGWLLLAELADRFRKAIVFAEWSGYPPGSTSSPGNPNGEVFIAAFWDFCRQHSHLIGAECYFDRASCSIADRPDWSATLAYQERWGAPPR